MKRESIGIRAGDLIRCPDRATARWHRVIRVARRKDGTRYVTIRRGKIGRLLGLGSFQRLEWRMVRGVGFGIKRAHTPNPYPRGTTDAMALDQTGRDVLEEA